MTHDERKANEKMKELLAKYDRKISSMLSLMKISKPDDIVDTYKMLL